MKLLALSLALLFGLTTVGSAMANSRKATGKTSTKIEKRMLKKNKRHNRAGVISSSSEPKKVK
jgi:hypothetical protein